MNVGQLRAAWPLLGEVFRTIAEGIRDGLTNSQIRARLAREDIVSDEALEQVRSSMKAMDDFIRRG